MRIIVSLLAGAALAAAVPAAAQQVVLPFTVKKDAGGAAAFEATTPPPQTAAGTTLHRLLLPRTAEDAVLRLECEAGADCSGVSATVLRPQGMVTLPVTAMANAPHRLIHVPASAFGPEQAVQLLVENGGQEMRAELALTPSLDGGSVGERLATSCGSVLALSGSFYDARENEAQFVVTPYATILARPDQPVDENDRVVVYVVGRSDALQNLRIRRSSLARSGGTVTFQAMDAALTPGAAPGGDRGTSDCTVARAELGDFTGGKGEVEIVSVAGGGDRAFGKFDFTVNPLYSGAFSLGPVFTWNDDRAYGVLPDRTITETASGDVETHYVVAYTHFLGRRDTEKARSVYIDPVLAVQPNEFLDHVFAGLSVDLLHGSVFLLGGAHGGEIDRIDPNSGLRVGGKLPAEYTNVPTRSEWEWGFFGGLTIDLRAAAGLVRKAADTALR